MLFAECFANFVRMNYMFYPHSFVRTTTKIISKYFALSNGVQKRTSSVTPSLRARRSRSVAIQKTHFVRLKAPSLLLRRVPRLATRWVRRGVGGGYFVAKIPQTPRHYAPKNAFVSQNLLPNSLKIQLPQFLECVK